MITILCEDLQHACFVRRFLMNRRWTRHDLREVYAPPGTGSGLQWVRDRFPTELRAYRSKCKHLRIGLIAVVDADEKAVADRIEEIGRACDSQGVERRKKGERVLLVVPKRRIETWFAYLSGENVNEREFYRHFEYEKESQCHPDADELDRMCRVGRFERNPPESLELCCKEFRPFWRLVK